MWHGIAGLLSAPATLCPASEKLSSTSIDFLQSVHYIPWLLERPFVLLFPKYHEQLHYLCPQSERRELWLNARQS